MLLLGAAVKYPHRKYDKFHHTTVTQQERVPYQLQGMISNQSVIHKCPPLVFFHVEMNPSCLASEQYRLCNLTVIPNPALYQPKQRIHEVALPHKRQHH